MMSPPTAGHDHRYSEATSLRADAPALVQVDLSALAERGAELVLAGLQDRGSAPPSWFALEHAAEYLGWLSERLRELVQRRAVPFHQERRGARIAFNRRELDEWLLGQ